MSNPGKRIMVQYRVKPELVAENEAAIRRVYEELRQKAPAGIRYSTFKLEDGVTFVHLASVETPDGRNPLFELEAFKAFAEGVKTRAEAPATTRPLSEIGSYRFFDDPE